MRPTSQMLSDILSRLVETVAEQGEDMQVILEYFTLYNTVPPCDEKMLVCLS